MSECAFRNPLIDLISFSNVSLLLTRPRHLSHRGAAELAFQATRDNADSLILLLMGIKEHRRPIKIEPLINAAIIGLVRTCSVYTELKDEYVRILFRKFRYK